MSKQEIIKVFGNRNIRSVWDDEAEKWYFAIVDVVAVLTDSKSPSAYWRKLKQRLKAEGNEPVTNCHGLKMTAADGKMRMMDVSDQEQYDEYGADFEYACRGFDSSDIVFNFAA